jgi:hypothetical protein
MAARRIRARNGREQMQQHECAEVGRTLLDDFVGAQEDASRKLNPDRSCGLKVDH